jgi:DNA-binding response OmpR family regulator
LLGSRWRQRGLLERQRELEGMVSTRTHELVAQAERLMEVDRLKTRFFVNVGHEFRTPLTLVLGPLDDLLRDASARLAPRVREQVEMAQRNARRVLELIIEILDVNRLEQGRLAFRRERLALDVLLRRALDEARPLAARYGHELLEMPWPDEPLEVEVDPVQIERCVSNLIANAAKFMRRDGRIEVALARVDDGAQLSVRDHGRGIAADALPHVFDRFFQTEGSDGASGYGVGLALVREIVEGHGGRIGVSSVPDEGSEFRIWLPLAGAMPIADPSAAVAPAHTSMADAGPLPVADASVRRARPLVLVVDDHDDIRHRLKQLFEAQFEVAQAGDGPSAWRLACELLPDVMVCDVMMPGFDGVELTRRLRANPETAAIAVLLLTAKAGSEHAVVGLRAGANDYLDKPFDSSELLARVDGLLAQAQRLRRRLALERERAATPEPVDESVEARWQRKLDRVLEQQLDQSAFGVDELAQAMHLDRTQLFRRCKHQFGMSPSEYQRERRLARARELLCARAGSVTEVAYAVGFESLSSFTRAFKTRYGSPPSTVRETPSAAEGP